jgi:hypothetical protein
MISLSRLRAHVDLQANQESELIAVRDEIITAFETLTGLRFNRRTDFTELTALDSREYQEVLLSLTPVLKIKKVEEKEPTDATWSTLVIDSDYEFIPYRRVRKIHTTFSRRVRVTYDGGYDEQTCPQDIQRALLSQASFILQRNSKQNISVQSTSVQHGVVTFLEPTFHPIFKEIAKNYQRKV